MNAYLVKKNDQTTVVLYVATLIYKMLFLVNSQEHRYFSNV